MNQAKLLAVAALLAAVALSAVGPKPTRAGESRQDRLALGLKEALGIGVRNAVDLNGRVDGYFKNEAIKITTPRQLRSVEKLLRFAGQDRQVDAFVLAMNRAAERAAPAARPIFTDAIREMTFDDARRILTSKDAAATAYFKEKTTERLAKAFRPIVSEAMDEEDVTDRYRKLMDRVQALPLGDQLNFDLEKYVVSKSLDGLFFMVAKEEKKIRKNPAARVTDLLKDVFGGVF
jgi:hypothetical protein